MTDRNPIASLALVLFLTACGGGHTPAPVTRPATVDAAVAPDDEVPQRAIAGVALEVTPKQAEVVIDGESYGAAVTLAPVLELSAGIHTLTISHPGHKTYRVEFTVSDATETFKVTLEPVR